MKIWKRGSTLVEVAVVALVVVVIVGLVLWLCGVIGSSAFFIEWLGAPVSTMKIWQALIILAIVVAILARK